MFSSLSYLPSFFKKLEEYVFEILLLSQDSPIGITFYYPFSLHYTIHLFNLRKYFNSLTTISYNYTYYIINLCKMQWIHCNTIIHKIVYFTQNFLEQLTSNTTCLPKSLVVLLILNIAALMKFYTDFFLLFGHCISLILCHYYKPC